ncbi:MAG: MFS transporter [Sphingomonadales bacterium]|nr:MFS transporter [Sphingomonadales bacterium]
MTVVVLLSVVYTFNYMDRQLLAILSEPVRTEMHLSYTQIGMLTGLTFALFYTTCGIPLAWLADHTNRVRLIAIALSVWSLFSAACGLATNFTTLALARIGVGVGEAGGSPPAYSLISDYFPPERRGGALAIYALGIPVGAGLGSALGASIAAQYGWRMAFIAIGLPGLLLAVLVLLVIREPRRGQMDAPIKGQDADQPSLPLSKAVTAFLTNPTLASTAIAAGLTNFWGQGMANNAAAYLISNLHMSLTEVAIYFSSAVAVSSGLGTLASGWFVDRLAQRNPKAYALVPAAAVALGAPFYLGVLIAPTWPLAVASLTIGFGLGQFFLTPAITLAQNAVPPSQRGTSGAMLILIINLIGLACGPLYVGLVADQFRAQYGVVALRYGLLALMPFVPITLGAYLVSARFIARDTNLRMQVAASA